jgi:putative membrane protein
LLGHGLLLRRRALIRTTLLVPRQRVQYAGLTQSIFQRRRALASFEIGTAGPSGGRRFSVRHLDVESGARLLAAGSPTLARAG